MDKVKQTIQSAIKENDSHVQRLERSKDLLAKFFPLDVQSFPHISEEQIEHIDQFIYRFTRLQDSMGTRLLPAIHSWLEDSTKALPFIDIINRLEKLQLIEDVQQWQLFRNLRNNLEHDYPESLEQTVNNLNLLFQKIDLLKYMYLKIRDYWLERSKPNHK